MSGSFGESVSSFLAPNQLFDLERLRQAPQIAEDAHLNALMQRQVHQQQMGAADTEAAARLAGTLLTNFDTPEQRAAAYPGFIAEHQARGLLKNAPAEYPGDERAKAIWGMGTSAEKQAEMYYNRGEAKRALGILSGGGGQTGAGGATGAASPAGAAPDYSVPRGVRNNNPLNLSFANQPGATRENHPNPRFAAFATPEEGVNAAVNQLKLYQSRGNNTLRGMISTWAPPSENDTEAYVRHVAQVTGLNPDAPVNLNDAAVASKLVQAMARHETGRPLDAAIADRGVAGAPRGVAARTGGVDVAGPGAPTRPSVAAPGAVEPETGLPVVTSPVAAPGTAAPVAAPPAPGAPAAPPAAPGAAPAPAPFRSSLPPLLPSGLDATQEALIRERLTGRNPNTNAILDDVQKMQSANRVARQQEETSARLLRTEDRTVQQQEQTLEFKRREDQRQQDEAVRAADKAKRDKKFTGAPTGYQWNDEGTELVRSPGFQGAEKDERLDYRLDHGDPNSSQYAADYAAKKWQMSQSGNVIENDMSMYRPPAQAMQRPTYLPQPSATALEDVRKVTLDADTTVQSIDNYLKVLGETDGATLGAFLNNPRDPKAQKLLGAFDAMKMAMRGPSAMNTGVLQPAEFTMLKEDLTSPQTVRGLTGTTEAAGARLGQIKLTLLRKADAELRSVGKDGILVRTEKEFNALPSGTTFYDKNGNRRTKE